MLFVDFCRCELKGDFFSLPPFFTTAERGSFCTITCREVPLCYLPDVQNRWMCVPHLLLKRKIQSQFSLFTHLFLDGFWSVGPSSVNGSFRKKNSPVISLWFSVHYKWISCVFSFLKPYQMDKPDISETNIWEFSIWKKYKVVFLTLKDL